LKKNLYFGGKEMVYYDMNEFIYRYEELKKKLKQKTITEKETMEYFEIRELGAACRRYRHCQENIPYLRKLIQSESDEELLEIYHYDLDQLEIEMKTLEKKIEKSGKFSVQLKTGS